MILEQMIEETLGYIEKESAYWDEEKLKTGDLDFTFQHKLLSFYVDSS